MGDQSTATTSPVADVLAETVPPRKVALHAIPHYLDLYKDGQKVMKKKVERRYGPLAGRTLMRELAGIHCIDKFGDRLLM